MKVQVNVTADDIKKGERGSCWTCPIGLALVRATDSYRMIRAIYDMAAYGRSSYLWGPIRLPPEASRFIVDFDQGRAALPLSFEIYLPEA